ncbi:citrate synthase 2 [Arsenicicoccus sp. oral taxon 190]|uniref:citrate synthase 2 n=1 Tax=Arsenicicoccus sp. oral taxon 190 TaxID=1658671 RepID=UPI00067A407E|nr:citrate synthase 2 [Arsenicicoccus sp. oral taxon 190]AKT50230.1 citrate synthase 2 [Arsenicicoccus sp. oral taxon 190]
MSQAHPAWVTSIAEADRDSGTLRYRGVDVRELVGRVPFEQVWGLLVDDALTPGLPPAEPFPLPVRTGDVRVDVQSALAQLAPVWGFRPLLDIDAAQAREDLARASVMALSFIAQSARGEELPAVPQREVDRGRTLAERFMIRWRGDPDPRHVAAVDAYWVAIAEHGLNPSSLAARVIASTGADAAACLSGAVGAVSGPLHGGAPRRVLWMLEDAAAGVPVETVVREALDDGGRLMGFGHRVYRDVDPRAAVLKALCERLQAPHLEAACALEAAALDVLRERSPDRVIATNVEFWAAVILHLAQVPAPLVTPMFACGRTAGWSAHVLEQKALGRMIRPTATYAGPPPRPVTAVAGG